MKKRIQRFYNGQWEDVSGFDGNLEQAIDRLDYYHRYVWRELVPHGDDSWMIRRVFNPGPEQPNPIALEIGRVLSSMEDRPRKS